MRTRRTEDRPGALFASPGLATSVPLPDAKGRRGGSRNVSPDWGVVVVVAAGAAGDDSAATFAASTVGALVWRLTPQARKSALATVMDGLILSSLPWSV